MTVGEQIARLSAVKSRIRNSIIAKGVAVPTDSTFFSYADFIRQIEGGEADNHVIENVGITYLVPFEANGFDEIKMPDRVYGNIIEDASIVHWLPWEVRGFDEIGLSAHEYRDIADIPALSFQ